MNIFKSNCSTTCNCNSNSNYNFHNTPTIAVANYKVIAEEFLKYYYTLYDNNYATLGALFTNTACITFVDEEFTKFGDLLKKINDDFKIYKFTHKNITYNSQQIGDKLIVINTAGYLSVNNSADGGRFTETIVIVRDDNNVNKYYINNAIFKVTQ